MACPFVEVEDEELGERVLRRQEGRMAQIVGDVGVGEAAADSKEPVLAEEEVEVADVAAPPGLVRPQRRQRLLALFFLGPAEELDQLPFPLRVGGPPAGRTGCRSPRAEATGVGGGSEQAAEP